MSKGQVATEFEWLAGGSNDQSSVVETSNFQFLKEGYLNMTEEESDHIPHGVYSTTLPQSPTAGGPVMDGVPVMGGAHAMLVRRTSDPTIKVQTTLHCMVYCHTHTHTHTCTSASTFPLTL